MTYALSLLLCAVVVLGGKFREPYETNLTDAMFPRTDPKTVGLIYQMLEVVDEVFSDNGIAYWIDGGTALGAVRHQGCIPWDDDADLAYHIEDEERILSLGDEFAKHGLFLSKERLLKVYPSSEMRYPYIDLAAYTLCEDGIYHWNFKMGRHYIFRNFYWKPDEVYPLTKVKFGPIFLSAAHDMLRYLCTGYGDDCLHFATYKMAHGGDHRPLINRKVRIVDFSSALYEMD